MVTPSQLYDMVMANDTTNLQYFAPQVPRKAFIRNYPDILRKAPIDTIPYLVRNDLILVHAYRGGWYDAVRSEDDVRRLIATDIDKHRIPLCFIVVSKKYSGELLAECVAAGFPSVISNTQRKHSLYSLLCNKENNHYIEHIYKLLPMDSSGAYLIDAMTKQLQHLSHFTFGFIGLWHKVLAHTFLHCKDYSMTKLFIVFLQMQNFELNYIYENILQYLMEITPINFKEILQYFEERDQSNEYAIYRLLYITHYRGILIEQLKGTKWEGLQQDIAAIFDP